MARKAKPETAVEEAEADAPVGNRFVDMTVGLVSSYVSRNQVPMSELATLIATFHNALTDAAAGTPATADKKPAVTIKKSIGDDYIICLEDGKKLTMLKRYLRSQYNMSPEEYRKKWDLPHDYPMVAPAYARLRSAFAKRIGLGRVPVARGRRPKAAA
ncbi:MAG: MucR family transcriptional regulator [Alphaproteobacteria bacterium]|nr:MucR family transcriptional regulator [Alphaproteobacteria bacterium]